MAHSHHSHVVCRVKHKAILYSLCIKHKEEAAAATGVMSDPAPEASTDCGFTNVMARVFNALDVARREMASQRDEDNLLRVTRSTFRR